LQGAYDRGDHAALIGSGETPNRLNWGPGTRPCYDLGVSGNANDEQLSQFVRDGARFTLLAAVLEAVLIVVIFVLASR
jgi:hypothetical protein